jgi:nitrogen regulatory protein PII
MKLIVAMINSERVEAVQTALRPLDAVVMYVSSVGDLEQPLTGHYRGADYNQPTPRTRLEIVVVNEALLQETVDAIARAAAIDERGSRGSIFVIPLQAWIRRAGNDVDAERQSTEAL